MTLIVTAARIVACILLLGYVEKTVAGSLILSNELRSSTSTIYNLRGGSQNRSRTKSKRSKSEKGSIKKRKSDISKAIKQDASEMMGDAIRYVYPYIEHIFLTIIGILPNLTALIATKLVKYL